jgi:simple sugar transport system ATP-binding protein
MNPQTVLAMTNITKRFGAVLANDDISLELKAGEMLALLGENGAGKTTLMNILFGHYLSDSGTVKVGGALLPPGRPRAAIAAGIGMVHQHFALADNLTVFENITAGTERLGSLRQNRKIAWLKLQTLASQFGLGVDFSKAVGDLALGERQRVEILKVLYRDAKILILDEPTAVLTQQEGARLFETLRRMTKDGLSVIFISHKLDEVLSADRIIILRAGKSVAERMANATGKNELAELMVGHRVIRPVRTNQTAGAVLMSGRNLTVRTPTGADLIDANFEVRAGEILGIIGVSGNGQTALSKLASGQSQPSAGEFELFGSPARHASPAAFAAAGIARIPEDRHREGAVGEMMLWENAVLERIRDRRFSRFGLVNRRAARNFTDAVIKRFDVRGGTHGSSMRLLSGGNIQKLILGRNLIDTPRLLVAAQPSRGLDEGAIAAIHADILAVRKAGVGVLLISEDLDEILALSDRIQAIFKGRLSESFEARGTNVRQLGLMMAGHWGGVG